MACGEPRDVLETLSSDTSSSTVCGPGETHTVARVFGNAPLVGTFHIPYVHKVAVVFEFENVVVCRTCRAPSNQNRPRGRVVRVSFDRRTHLLTGSMRFCEVRGIKPPLSVCLAR